MEKKRVKYKKSPLIEVIYQLRFPTILSIESEQPVQFQERIREKYPFYDVQTEEQSNISFDPRLKSVSMNKLGENKNYSFIDVDRVYKVNLTASFISISTKLYTQWETFWDNAQYVIKVFEEIYNPSFYNRVGLRYRNVIRRSILGLEECKWKELVSPEFLGIMGKTNEEGVKVYKTATEYQTDVEDVISTARIELVHVNHEEELCFLIDCDYYTNGINESSKIKYISDSLHEASNNFMQSAFTERLSMAMEPEDI